MKYPPFGSAGMRVSQVALGTGHFGKGWGYGDDPEAPAAVPDADRLVTGNS